MKGLLIKDLYTLIKQMRLYLIIIFIFAFIPNINFMAIIWMAMLPISSFAFDESSKWTKFEKMLPYSAKDVVLSKYILGYIFMACALALSLIAQTAVRFINPQAVTVPEDYIVMILFAVVSVTLTAIYIPVVYKLGIAKGRMFFMLMFFVIFIVIGIALSLFTDGEIALPTVPSNLSIIVLIIVAASVLINVISIMLSIKIYKKRQSSKSI